MDLRHFGDSYDVVKQSLLRRLADLGPWSAHPMFTADVSIEDERAFGRFLGVPLVSRERLTAETDRTGYFETCRGLGHLFLDPDTGLRVGPRGRNPKYLYGDELKGLAHCRASYLTMTFDQSLSRAGDAKVQVREKLHELGVPGFAYVTHVAFIVVGYDRSTVERAEQALLSGSKLPPERLVRGVSRRPGKALRGDRGVGGVV